MAEVLPLLYLHGLSSSDFAPALEQFLGSDAGLSAATIARLASQWQDEARAFNARSLAGTVGMRAPQLNDRPRARLGYAKPIELMTELVLLRQYFARGTDLLIHSAAELQRVANQGR